MRKDLAIHKPAETAEALLAMEDAEFVSCAYLTVLGRPVDPDGFAEYLRHIRAGADKSEVVAAIASSAEALDLPLNRLPGLEQIVRDARRKRALSFLTRAWKRMARRIDVCEYRIGKIEQTVGSRLDKLENEVATLLRERQSYIRGRIQEGELSQDPELQSKLRQMSLHARSMYFQLEDAVKNNLRSSAT